MKKINIYLKINNYIGDEILACVVEQRLGRKVSLLTLQEPLSHGMESFKYFFFI